MTLTKETDSERCSVKYKHESNEQTDESNTEQNLAADPAEPIKRRRQAEQNQDETIFYGNLYLIFVPLPFSFFFFFMSKSNCWLRECFVFCERSLVRCKMLHEFLPRGKVTHGRFQQTPRTICQSHADAQMLPSRSHCVPRGASEVYVNRQRCFAVEN